MSPNEVEWWSWSCSAQPLLCCLCALFDPPPPLHRTLHTDGHFPFRTRGQTTETQTDRQTLLNITSPSTDNTGV